MVDRTPIALLKPGVIAGTNPVNELIRRHNANGARTGIVEDEIFAFNGRLGKIVNAGPDGQADFTNENYWVLTAFIANGATAPSPQTDQLQIIGATPSMSGYEIITVCNMAEKVAGTHSLPTDGSCAVIVNFCGPDLGNPMRPRFAMTHGGAGGDDTGLGQYQGMTRMNVAQNQMGSSYPFAHELL